MRSAFQKIARVSGLAEAKVFCGRWKVYGMVYKYLDEYLGESSTSISYKKLENYQEIQDVL